MGQIIGDWQTAVAVVAVFVAASWLTGRAVLFFRATGSRSGCSTGCDSCPAQGPRAKSSPSLMSIDLLVISPNTDADTRLDSFDSNQPERQRR